MGTSFRPAVGGDSGHAFAGVADMAAARLTASAQSVLRWKWACSDRERLAARPPMEAGLVRERPVRVERVLDVRLGEPQGWFERVVG